MERAQKAKLAAGYLLLFDWSNSLETAAEEASRPSSLFFPSLFLFFLYGIKKKKKKKGKWRELYI